MRDHATIYHIAPVSEAFCLAVQNYRIGNLRSCVSGNVGEPASEQAGVGTQGTEWGGEGGGALSAPLPPPLSFVSQPKTRERELNQYLNCAKTCNVRQHGIAESGSPIWTIRISPRLWLDRVRMSQFDFIWSSLYSVELCSHFALSSWGSQFSYSRTFDHSCISTESGAHNVTHHVQRLPRITLFQCHSCNTFHGSSWNTARKYLFWNSERDTRVYGDFVSYFKPLVNC